MFTDPRSNAQEFAVIGNVAKHIGCADQQIILVQPRPLIKRDRWSDIFLGRIKSESKGYQPQSVEHLSLWLLLPRFFRNLEEIGNPSECVLVAESQIDPIRT
ncbi:hypothetical protein DAH55_08250 [Sphingomonas koreensis]|nr:hypothetical protein DAH56_07685 [Sphingomonas koreensis]RSU69948.1 hypothetical protein DAH55_08250 [Sphingomonas koreensis]